VVDLFPDLDAPLTLSSWVSGRDPGMEAIKRDLGRDRSARSERPLTGNPDGRGE
jgi:hypothetical protein